MAFPVEFESYEVFRIVLPGYLGLGAILLFLYTFSITQGYLYAFSKAVGSTLFLTLIIGVGLFLGLLLYAYDHPRRCHFYKTHIKTALPSLHLKKILCDSCAEKCENAINDQEMAGSTYFYLFYGYFDSNSQRTTNFFGSIYRILADMRAIFGLMWVSQLLITLFNLISLIMNGASGTPSLIAVNSILFVMFLALWLGLHPEFYSNRLSKGDQYMLQAVNFQKRYLDLKINDFKPLICLPLIRKRTEQSKS